MIGAIRTYGAAAFSAAPRNGAAAGTQMQVPAAAAVDCSRALRYGWFSTEAMLSLAD